MKELLNSGTLAIMVFGTGPLAILFWALGVRGEIVLSLWIITGIILKLTITSNTEDDLSVNENTEITSKFNKTKDQNVTLVTKSERNYLNSEEDKTLTEPVIFYSKESYYAFWHSLIELNPNLSQKRVTCTIIDKYEVNLKGYDEIVTYKYILLNMIRDRNLKKTDGFFINFSVMQTIDEKKKWHNYQIRRLLEKVESKSINSNYELIDVGSNISFDIQYNQPPILTYPIEVGDGQYQLNWEELEKQGYIGEISEYVFSNFNLEKH